jgi:Flp pilus assembly protein TadD
VLGRAAELNPLPEYEWSLAEALRALGQESEAAAAESHLRQKGAVADPRTCSLYLATRGEAPETALRLARSELETRQDVFTHDALAWALAASGQLEEAGLQMKRALREGTQDARLFFHAAAIARKAGHHADAQHWAAQAAAFAHTLLPSERQQLNQINSPIAARVSVAGGETKENTP